MTWEEKRKLDERRVRNSQREFVARAILAERERAAKIAEEVGIPRVVNSDRILVVPVDIAAAIRKGSGK